jgi:hypothetical protein
MTAVLSKQLSSLHVTLLVGHRRGLGAGGTVLYMGLTYIVTVVGRFRLVTGLPYLENKSLCEPYSN